MVCIYCGGVTRVSNSRLQRRVNQVWRRRVCQNCPGVFTTHEQAALGSALAVRYEDDARLQPFSRERLLISLYESCKHRHDAIGDSEALSQTVISQLLGNMQAGAINRRDIVIAATAVLGRFDKTAAAVYAAFHPL